MENKEINNEFEEITEEDGIFAAEDGAVEIDDPDESDVIQRSETGKAIIPENLKDPQKLAELIVRVLDSKKAHDLKLLYIGKKTVIADYFVICTGTSNTQLRALSGELEEKLGEQGVIPGHIEGYNEASWIIMDYASVIVHIFNRETRSFYNLEKLWDEGEEIDISHLLD